MFRNVELPPYRIGTFPIRRRRHVGTVMVDAHSALMHSAVWASLRLRADLMSAMPLDTYRKVQGVDVEVPTPPVLIQPGGDDWDINAWLWATQFDLDRVGNAYGLITERDGAGRPRAILPIEHRDVLVHLDRQGIVTYTIRGRLYQAKDVWHERQYRLPGEVMGLSAISMAAYSIGQYLSAQQFGIDWFANGGSIPSGVLTNDAKIVNPEDADDIKQRFKTAIADRDVFVTGKDWTYTTLQVQANEAQFLASQEWSSHDVGRFIGVPADLIDLAVQGQHVTYANVTQRNLQFLILNLWPAIRRRQTALSKVLAQPRFVRFNTDAILQLDPQTKSTMLGQQIRDRMRAPSEVRRVDGYEPFTDEQLAEFDRLFPKSAAPQKSTTNGE
jgi:HK97 family phage portal protein